MATAGGQIIKARREAATNRVGVGLNGRELGGADPSHVHLQASHDYASRLSREGNGKTPSSQPLARVGQAVSAGLVKKRLSNRGA